MKPVSSHSPSVLRLLSLVLVGLLIASTATFAIPCGPGQVVGTTIYITTTYTPTGAGAWEEGTISWWRSVNWKCNQQTKTVQECYNSEWDRFWAVNGTCHTVTVVNAALAPRTTHETRYFCGSTAPPDTLPEKEEDIRLGSIAADKPGSTAKVFAAAAHAIDAPGVGVPDIKSAVWEDILVTYGEHFKLAAKPFDEYYRAALSVQDPENVIHPELDKAFLNLARQTAAVGADMASAKPKNAGAYARIASELKALIDNPAMADNVIYAKSYPFLAQSADAMSRMSAQVASGLIFDDQRAAFLDNIEKFRKGYLGFALEFTVQHAAAGDPDQERFDHVMMDH